MGWQAKSFAPVIPAAANNRLEGLCDGTLDAAFVVAGHPNQAIGDLTGRCKARLIPIEGEQVDALLKQHPYYQRSRIGANLYPGQPSGVNTFAVTAELVVLASLPEDEVRTVRDVLSGRLKQFTRLHPALTALTLEGMQGEAEVPRHAGMADAAPALQPEALNPAPATSEALATSAAQPTEVEHPAGEDAKQTAGETGAPSPEGTPATSSGGALLPTPSAATTTEPGASSVLEGAAVEQGGKLTGTAAPSPSAVMSGNNPPRRHRQHRHRSHRAPPHRPGTACQPSKTAKQPQRKRPPLGGLFLFRYWVGSSPGVRQRLRALDLLLHPVQQLLDGARQHLILAHHIPQAGAGKVGEPGHRGGQLEPRVNGKVRHYGHPEARLGPIELGVHAAHLHDAAAGQTEQRQRGVDERPGAGVVAQQDQGRLVEGSLSPACARACQRARPWPSAHQVTCCSSV